jgi:hypothetical protein
MKNICFYIVLTILLIFPATCAFCQVQSIDAIYEELNKVTKEKGKCSQNCLMPLKNFEDSELIPVYTGKDEDIDGIERVRIEMTPKSEKWVKRIAKDCLSRDPNDCTIWCLVDVPAEYKLFYLVQDTNLVKDFELRALAEYTTEEKLVTDFVEVVCPEYQNAVFKRELNIALRRKGYATKSEDDKYLKKELLRYQRNHNLPVGGYNLPTMQHLGLW